MARRAKSASRARTPRALPKPAPRPRKAKPESPRSRPSPRHAPNGAVVGVGIDLVEVDRIARMIADHGDRFLLRVFTAPERAHSQGRKSSAQHLAARFAAKEAALKALGTGLSRGISWQDVEVVTTDAGQPKLRLHGSAASIAKGLGAVYWSVSLSHTRTLAIAIVIASR